MAIHVPGKLVTDSSELQGCSLVLHDGAPNRFALTCRANNQSYLAILDSAPLNGRAVPWVDQFSGECISFGPGFTVVFDLEPIAFNASATVGDLLVSGDRLLVKCHGHFGVRFLDLSDGQLVVPSAGAAVIKKWSIYLDLDPTQPGKQRVTVFSRAP